MPTKKHPYQPKIKCRSMSRRLAYKIYNNVTFWLDLCDLKKAGVDFKDEKAVAAAMFRSVKELKQDLRRYKTVYTKEQFKRARVKVNRDMFSKRAFNKWRRYKIAKMWRRKPHDPQMTKHSATYANIVKECKAMLEQIQQPAA